MAVVAVAVAGAGAPGIAIASGDLTESQRLVSLSELNGQAVVLAHSLADERDAVTEYAAAGRTTTSGARGLSESLRARVDRQVSEIRQDAPASLRRVLDALPKVRQEGLTGRGAAMDTYTAYTETVQALQDLSRDLARRIPPRASGGPAEALPTLGSAVERASATRALLLAALSAQDGRAELSATAQQAHVQEQAALADFDRTAPESATDRYANTVNGTEVSTAERDLARLTDEPQLSPEDLAVDQDRVDAALSARLDRMRAVESALTTSESAQLAQLRDDDVTALELRIGLVGFCLLLAAGISISAARSMTRPLAVLRLGSRRVAADPTGEEPVRFTGRNDEFADIVRAVNELREAAVRLHARSEQLGEDRTRLVAERQRLADVRAELEHSQEELTERFTRLHDRVNRTYVQLALRTLGLVERQLVAIEALEEREQDPERLETLYGLDHFATEMRRHSENLLVMAGGEYGSGHTGPVPLLDVLRAAISEIERYKRVQIQTTPPHVQIAGFAADAVSHLVAELLENATAYSPPEVDVQLSAWLLESGEVMLSIQDEGIGMTTERLEELNARLADPSGPGSDGDDDVLGLGLYVVARLASRHGVRVQLRDQTQGGVTAVVVLPKSILPTRPAPVAAGSAHASVPAQSVALPGSEAEANSNTLRRRGTSLPIPQQTGPEHAAPEEGSTGPSGSQLALSSDDPLVAAAERAVAEAEQQTDAGPRGEEYYRPATPGADFPGDDFADPAYGRGQSGPLGDQAGGSGDAGTGTFPRPGAPWEETGEFAVPPAGSGLPTGSAAEPGVEEGAPWSGTASPYAVGPDEHARAQDVSGAGDVDQPTWELRMPQLGEEQAETGRSYGRVAAETGTGFAAPVDAGPIPDPAPPVHDSSGWPAPGGPAVDGPQDAQGLEPQQEGPRTGTTGKGLPKRTPKIVTPTGPTEPQRKRSVDAEALRRRLGGFQQGSRSGRRDVEAEIAERTGEHKTGALDEGGTVEEARG